MMPDDDTPDEGGLEPAEDYAPEVEAEAPEQEAPEPETYTREQLTELLGPRFAERFAGAHEGEEALRQFGQAFDNTLSLVGRGAHLEPQDAEFYKNLGIDPPPAPEPEYEEPQPAIWNAPWIEPNEWEAINQLANSEQPEHRQRAAMAILKSDAPEEYKQGYWDNAYGQGSYQALLYQQQVLLAQQEQMREELRNEMRQEFAPFHSERTEVRVNDLMEAAKAQIPGFVENVAMINELWNERTEREPAFTKWFFESATRDQQMKELRRINIVAASEMEPHRKAAQQAATAETDAAKQRARTETSRTSGAPETEQSAAKRKSLEDARRVGSKVF